jgi:hypothetical protein
LIYTFYVVITKTKLVKTPRTDPKFLQKDERKIKINLNVDSSIFLEKILESTIEVNSKNQDKDFNIKVLEDELNRLKKAGGS